jgi:hypothetical protein
MASTHSEGRTAHVNGMDTYFEVHGTGDPLVFLADSPGGCVASAAIRV